jgi:diacylglycerol kinase
MRKFSNKTMFSSFKYAFRGIQIAIKTQKNVRAGLLIGVVALTVANLMHFSCAEMAMAVLGVSFVIFAELINTSIEYVFDTYFGYEYSEVAKIAKDVSAGAVLFAIIVAAIVGLLLFGPRVIEILKIFL